MSNSDDAGKAAKKIPKVRRLEQLHRTLFDHPDRETWNGTRSLAQPSFLKQTDTYSDVNGSRC